MSRVGPGKRPRPRETAQVRGNGPGLGNRPMPRETVQAQGNAPGPGNRPRPRETAHVRGNGPGCVVLILKRRNHTASCYRVLLCDVLILKEKVKSCMATTLLAATQCMATTFGSHCCVRSRLVMRVTVLFLLTLAVIWSSSSCNMHGISHTYITKQQSRVVMSPPKKKCVALLSHSCFLFASCVLTLSRSHQLQGWPRC